MPKSVLKRREFLAGAAASSAAAVFSSPAIVTAKNTFRWKIATIWPPGYPVLQEAPERFAELVKEATDGRLRIRVYAGGELVPALGVFDTVVQGTIQGGVGSPYYWSGKIKAAQLFGSLPFGMTAQQFNSWLIAGDGAKLWTELYGRYNIIPFSFGNSGTQMGGWFNKEINSVEDFKGLKMRMPGIGAKVLAKLGANMVLLPGSEVYTSLERGTIDAAEWIGPFYDVRMGLDKTAKFYYSPGWQEPQSNLELFIGKAAWDSLPKDIQQIVRLAAQEIAAWTLAQSEAHNAAALEKLKNDKSVSLREFPAPVLRALNKASNEVLEELANEDADAKRIYASYKAFMERARAWSAISEEAYDKAVRA